MPITYSVDHDARLIRSEVRGDFSAAEMLRVVSEPADIAGRPGYHVLSDHRAIGAGACGGHP